MRKMMLELTESEVQDLMDALYESNGSSALFDKLHYQKNNQPEELVQGYSRQDIQALSGGKLSEDEVEYIFDNLDDRWNCNIAGNDTIRDMIEEAMDLRRQDNGGGA